MDELNARRAQLKLFVRCPRCGRPPSLRIYDDAFTIRADLAPNAPVFSYACHVRGCGEPYDIPACVVRAAQSEQRKRAA